MSENKVEQQPKILVAVDEDEAGRRTVLRARSLARRIGAQMHLMHVVPGAPLWGFHPSEHSLRARSAKLRSWASDVLQTSIRASEVSVTPGAFHDAVARTAKRLDATLVVVPSERRAVDRERCVKENIGLVSTGQRPVLVVGRRRGSRAIVAGTALWKPELPVVRVARNVADALDARVTIVHNLLPSPFVADATLDRAGAVVELLDSTARRLGSRVLFTARPRIADALIDTAEAKDADLIVAGRTARKFEPFHSRGSTARSVLAGTRRSVLVVPIPRTTRVRQS